MPTQAIQFLNLGKSFIVTNFCPQAVFPHHLLLPLSYSNKQIAFEMFYWKLSGNKNMNTNIKASIVFTNNHRCTAFKEKKLNYNI